MNPVLCIAVMSVALLILTVLALCVSSSNRENILFSTFGPDFIVLTPKGNRVLFNDVHVKLKHDGTVFRLPESTRLTGMNVAKVSIMNLPPESNVVALGRHKPSSILSNGVSLTNQVRPTGDFIRLSIPNVYYSLKYISPIPI